MDYFICRTFSPVLSLLFSLTMDFVMSKIFFTRCIIFSLSHFPMSNKFCGSYNGVENYLSNIICWQTCQTLLSICRKHSVALHKACRTFSVEHFDVENLPWSMGKCIVEHFLSKIVCFPDKNSRSICKFCHFSRFCIIYYLIKSFYLLYRYFSKN